MTKLATVPEMEIPYPEVEYISHPEMMYGVAALPSPPVTPFAGVNPALFVIEIGPRKVYAEVSDGSHVVPAMRLRTRSSPIKAGFRMPFEIDSPRTRMGEQSTCVSSSTLPSRPLSKPGLKIIRGSADDRFPIPAVEIVIPP